MNKTIKYKEEDFEVNYHFLENAFRELKKLGYYTKTFEDVNLKEVKEEINRKYGMDKNYAIIINNPKIFGMVRIHWRGDPMEIIRVIQNSGLKVTWRGRDNDSIAAHLSKYLYDAFLRYEYDVYDSLIASKDRSADIYEAILNTRISKNSKKTCFDYLMTGGDYGRVKYEIQDKLKLGTFTMDYFYKFQGGWDKVLWNLQNMRRMKKIHKITHSCLA